MLSLPRPIYQNQQLGHMMIKHPDRRGLMGPRFPHCRRLQLDLIARPPLGRERTRRRTHWQDPLACEAARAAEESGMSHVLRACVWKGLVVRFIKRLPLRCSRTFLSLAAVTGWRPVMSWHSRSGGVRRLIKGEIPLHTTSSLIFFFFFLSRFWSPSLLVKPVSQSAS